MLFYTTTQYLPIFFIGGTKDTKYAPSNMFYDEYKDMEEAYEEEQFFDWESYGVQLANVFRNKIDKIGWACYGLNYIKNITITDFNMGDDNEDISSFILRVNTSLSGEDILSILDNIKGDEWMKEYCYSKYRIKELDHVIEGLPRRMNSTQKDVSMKAWAEFIIMYETFKAHGEPSVFRRINGDVNEMINGFMFSYPVGCVIRSTVPEEADYYLSHRYEGDILYHKAKDALGWAAWPEHPGADHLLEFFHWCVDRGYNDMDKVNELINNNNNK